MKAKDVKDALAEHINPEKAAFFPRFFKAGPGEYAEGDKFIGVVVPDQRRVARQFIQLPLSQVAVLLKSAIHEHRNTGVLILALRYQRAKADEARREVYDFTLKHMARINNWDLVDCAAPKITGPHMLAHPAEAKKIYRWCKSKDLWTRRMAIMSTYAFIRDEQYEHTLALSEALLGDEHDLIHKAVGWMLREVGNRDRRVEQAFLDAHADDMPRTMLRYAIEKFPPGLRKQYLARG